MGVGAHRRAGGGERSTGISARVCGGGDEEQPGMVCRGSRGGLPAGPGECADVYVVDGIAMAGEQYRARAAVSGEEQKSGGAGVAELEREMARTARAL